jgi:hypothetical protein
MHKKKKPVEHFNPVLSLDFEFLVSEAEKGKMKVSQ